VGSNLSPGKYCGGITILGGATVHFLPGEYIIDGGQLLAKGSSSMTGNNVCFLFTNGATVDLSGTADVDLSACTSGPMTDMIFASDRSEPRVTSILAGNNLFRLEGHVYLPSHDLRYTGGPSGGFPADFTTIAAATIRFDGSSRTEFRNKAGGSGNYSGRAFSHIFLTQ
jgi:hypothetical protein